MWRKSSHSGNDGSHCVELADVGGGVGVRDSKAPYAGYLRVNRASLRVLVAALKGERVSGGG